MKYAIIKDGKVTNIIEYDGKSKYKADGDLVKVPADSTASTGWEYKNDKFIEPPKPKKDK